MVPDESGRLRNDHNAQKHAPEMQNNCRRDRLQNPNMKRHATKTLKSYSTVLPCTAADMTTRCAFKIEDPSRGPGRVDFTRFQIRPYILTVDIANGLNIFIKAKTTIGPYQNPIKSY
jgi:hypothetical protein